MQHMCDVQKDGRAEKVGDDVAELELFPRQQRLNELGYDTSKEEARDQREQQRCSADIPYSFARPIWHFYDEVEQKGGKAEPEEMQGLVVDR